MPALLITYDLIKPGQDYQPLFDAIESLGPWARPVKSVWIVATSKSCAIVRNKLSAHIDANDKLLVIRLGSGWASKGILTRVTDWMHKHLCPL